MKIYRLSQTEKRKRRLIDYYSCMLAIKSDSDPSSPVFSCVEEFLDRIQTVNGINELRSESKDWHYNMDEVLRVYVSDNRDILSEKDIRRIINFAIITDQLFRGGTREYLVKLFWSQSLPKDLAYQLYRYMTVDKILVNSTYCNYILSDSEFPPELLADALKKYPNAPIAEWASENENCPEAELIEWRRKTAKIKEEDPSDPMSVEEIKSEKPSQLGELEKLVGYRNNQMTRNAEKTPPYIWKIKQCLRDDDRRDDCLEDFFRRVGDPAEVKQMDDEAYLGSSGVRGLIEEILRYESLPLTETAMNSILSLAEKTGELFILEEDDSRYIHRFFSRMPKLSKETFMKLYQYIKSKKIVSSIYIADIMLNPNCPIEILKDALFSYDVQEWVSEWASENESLPSDLKIKYLRQRGTIEHEKPDSVLEQVNQSPNTALESLENLAK